MFLRGWSDGHSVDQSLGDGPGSLSHSFDGSGVLHGDSPALVGLADTLRLTGQSAWVLRTYSFHFPFRLRLAAVLIRRQQLWQYQPDTRFGLRQHSQRDASAIAVDLMSATHTLDSPYEKRE